MYPGTRFKIFLDELCVLRPTRRKSDLKMITGLNQQAGCHLSGSQELPVDSAAQLGMYYLLLGKLEESRDCLSGYAGQEDALVSSTRLLNKIDAWLTIDSPHPLGSNHKSRISQLEKSDCIMAQLQSTAICLEPLSLRHTEAVYELATPEILNLTRLPAFSNMADVMNWIRVRAASPNDYTFGIAHTSLGFTGIISIKVIGSGGRFFFWVGQPFWGRGIATAAVCHLLRFAFDKLALEELFTIVFTHNHRSIRILHKVGFSSLTEIRKDLRYYRCGLSQLSEHEATSRLRRLFPPTRSNLMNQSNDSEGGQPTWPIRA